MTFCLLFAIICVIIAIQKREVFFMAKTANIYTRVDPEIKNQAEQILDQLGIPMSNAIGIFLRQVILHNGLPFDMTLPVSKPVAIGSLTKDQLDAELQKGFDDIENGRVFSLDEVDSEMKNRYGI